jgi:hypothetical protein
MPASHPTRAALTLLLGLAACVGNPPASTAPPPPALDTPEPAGPVPPTPAPVTPMPPTTTSITDALANVPPGVAANYVMSISADRSELTVDPRPRPVRRARDISGGFSARDSAGGGKILTLAGGPFRGGAWARASFRQRVQDPAQLEQLRRAGYDVDAVRDLLVVDGEHDRSPTVFAFSADPRKPGMVGVCTQVTLVDFVPGSPRLAVRKPVVYLYPEQRTRVHVAVDIAGRFTAVYPTMTDDGWRVVADPDGALLDESTGRRHRYLFWEGTSAGFDLHRERAFCVPGGEAAAFLERACARFALTDEECGDFVTYWLPTLARNPYNVIEFVDEPTYERYAAMRVTPRPDAVIRLFMVFRRSDVPLAVGAPELPQRARGRFTVVEWGGADLDERDRDALQIH